MNQQDMFDTTGWIDINDGQLFWQPHFIDKKEEQTLFSRLEKEIAWQQLPITLFGKTVLQPRLQAWFGETYTYSGLTLTPQPLPSLLIELKKRCEHVTQTSFNSVLANYYRDQRDHMGWHQDNEKELGHQPCIASLSFGDTRRFLLRHKKTGEKREYELGSGSLLIMAGELQTHWQHAIMKTAKQKGARINLTYRYIF